MRGGFGEGDSHMTAWWSRLSSGLHVLFLELLMRRRHLLSLTAAGLATPAVLRAQGT